MDDKDISIIKSRFTDATKIAPLPKFGEHYYSVSFADKTIKVFVKSGKTIIIPEN